MNRRSFLSLFAASAVLDPERLLWVPGRKLISIPTPTPEFIMSFFVTRGQSRSQVDLSESEYWHWRRDGELPARILGVFPVGTQGWTNPRPIPHPPPVKFP